MDATVGFSSQCPGLQWLRPDKESTTNSFGQIQNENELSL